MSADIVYSESIETSVGDRDAEFMGMPISEEAGGGTGKERQREHEGFRLNLEDVVFLI